MLPRIRLYQIRMRALEMVAMAFVEFKILDPVVRPNLVQMMDALSFGQRSVKVLLHNPTMFEHRFVSVGCPDLASDVSSRCYLFGDQSIRVSSGLSIKSLKATFVRAKLHVLSIAPATTLHEEDHRADFAYEGYGVKLAPNVSTPDVLAGLRARLANSLGRDK